MVVGGRELCRVGGVGGDAEDTADAAAATAAQPDRVVEGGQRDRFTIAAGFDRDAAAQLLRGLA